MDSRWSSQAGAPLPEAGEDQLASLGRANTELRRALTLEMERSRMLFDLLSAASSLIERAEASIGEMATACDVTAQRFSALVTAIDSSGLAQTLSTPSVVLQDQQQEAPMAKRQKVEPGGGLTGAKLALMQELDGHDARKRSLWLINAPPDYTRGAIEAEFARYGSLASCHTFFDVGVAVVVFRDAAAAAMALQLCSVTPSQADGGPVCQLCQPAKDLWVSGTGQRDEVEALFAQSGPVDRIRFHGQYFQVRLASTSSAMHAVLTLNRTERHGHALALIFCKPDEERPNMAALGLPGSAASPVRSPPPEEPALSVRGGLRPRDELPLTNTLWVGGLESGTTEGDLTEAFGKFGKVRNVAFRRPSYSAGFHYCFVMMDSLEDAVVAKYQLHGTLLRGSRLKVGYGTRIMSPRRDMPVCDLVVRPIVAEDDLSHAIAPYAQASRMRASKGTNSVLLRARNLEEAILVKSLLKTVGGTRVTVEYDRDHDHDR